MPMCFELICISMYVINEIPLKYNFNWTGNSIVPVR